MQGTPAELAPYARVDKDPMQMFVENVVDETPTPSHQAAHACANIAHKLSLGLLVSSAAVIRCAELAGNVFPEAQIDLQAPFGMSLVRAFAKRARQ